MCTVTIIPVDQGGFRLVSNRDELRTRPHAQPPSLQRTPGGGEGLWPVDAGAGGTWIAATRAGLALTLLRTIWPRGTLRPTVAIFRTTLTTFL